MRSVFYHGVSSRFCLSCKGFFLTPTQLEDIKETVEVDISEDPPKTFPGGSDAVSYCPACEATMTKSNYGKVLKTIVSVCENCKGIWLNKRDLERIEYDYSVVKRNRNKNLGLRVKCPACGFEQAKADKCIKCDIVFAKYNAARTNASVKQETTLVEKVVTQLEQKAEDMIDAGEAYRTRTRIILDALYHNSISFYLMKTVSWAFILVSVYLVWLILAYIFNNISVAPPKPTGIDGELSRVSLFYIFAIAMAGPVVLVIAFVLWRLLWFSLYGPIQALMHRYFHPLIKPVIAIGLLLLVLQSVALFAHGFWTTYWWLNQQVDQAKGHNISS